MSGVRVTIVHIHAPRGYYIGQVRPFGHRLWRTVTGKCKTDTGAMKRSVACMTRNHHRARVLFCTYDGWYEPIIVMGLKR